MNSPKTMQKIGTWLIVILIVVVLLLVFLRKETVIPPADNTPIVSNEVPVASEPLPIDNSAWKE